MIKSYAEKNYAYAKQLFNASTKFMFYTLLAIAIPLIFEMETIISLWLGQVTPEKVLFSQLIIIYIVCLAMHSPITIIMQASGHIKKYHLTVESVTLLCLPITWFLFTVHLPSYYVFYSMIGVCIAAHAVRLLCIRHFSDIFSMRQYLVSFVMPAIINTAICLLATNMLHSSIESSVLRIILVCTIIPFIVFMSGYILGMNHTEQEYLKQFVSFYIVKIRCHK